MSVRLVLAVRQPQTDQEVPTAHLPQLSATSLDTEVETVYQEQVGQQVVSVDLAVAAFSMLVLAVSAFKVPMVELVLLMLLVVAVAVFRQ
jgi:hypothetical protein